MKDRLAYKAGYKYIVHEDFSIQTPIKGFSAEIPGYISLNKNGILTVFRGYAWDGASGPAINTNSFRRGSLVHDALYQLIEEGVLPFACRLPADDFLIYLCKADGMWGIRSWWVKLAVNTFGARALENKNPVLFAPPT